MLTQQEKDWLERRKNLCSRCEYCLYGTPPRRQRGKLQGLFAQ